MPLLQPENVCKISGKLLVESVVAPVGGRVPQDYSPNLVGVQDAMKPDYIELLLCGLLSESGCFLRDYQKLIILNFLRTRLWSMLPGGKQEYWSKELEVCFYC